MREGAFQPVRVGVVGLGDFGRRHAVTLAALAEAELVALVDTDPRRIDAASIAVPGVPCWTNLDHALREAKCQAWVVSTSTASHIEVTRRILSTGLPALVEKPLAANLPEARSLAALVQDDSRNLMLGHIVLFNSEFRELCARTMQLGRIRYFESVRHRSVDHVERFPGEEPFHLLMVHDLYQLQALTGGREPAQFSGRLRLRADGAPDLSLAELSWPDGTIARLTASFLAPSALGDNGFDRVEVFGDGWGARLSPNPRPFEWWDNRVSWPMSLEIRSTETPSGMLAEELRCFCRVVRGTERVPIGARYNDAIQVMRWLDHLTTDAAAALNKPAR